MSLAGVLTRKGAAVTFSLSSAGAYDPATDTTSNPTTTSVSGHAMEIDGDPDLYKALNLIETDNPTLLFQPAVRGTYPALGSSVVWGGNTYTLKNRKMLAMNGTVTALRCVVGR